MDESDVIYIREQLPTAWERATAQTLFIVKELLIELDIPDVRKLSTKALCEIVRQHPVKRFPSKE